MNIKLGTLNIVSINEHPALLAEPVMKALSNVSERECGSS